MAKTATYMYFSDGVRYIHVREDGVEDTPCLTVANDDVRAAMFLSVGDLQTIRDEIEEYLKDRRTRDLDSLSDRQVDLAEMPAGLEESEKARAGVA